ncbi:MAG: hypothetical protein V4482_00550 [Pseudomonadota bacterium]
MSIINKTRLIHLGNTTAITKDTRLSPKFWAQCAAIIASFATMGSVHATSKTVDVESTAIFTVNTKISGGGTLIKSGTGTLLLNNDNSILDDGTSQVTGHTAALATNLQPAFTGATNVTAGILALQVGNALGGSGNTSVTTMTGGTKLQATATITLPNAIQLNASASDATSKVVVFDTTSSSYVLTSTGVLSEFSAAAAILEVDGTGTLVLDGAAANTYTGGTNLTGTSTLQIQLATASIIPAVGTVQLGNGTTLYDASTGATIAPDIKLNNISGAGNGTSTIKTDGTLTLNGKISSNLTFGGSSTATANTLIHTGAGTLVLANTGSTHNSADTATNLTITNGTVSVTADTQIPGGTLTLSGGKLLASAGYTSSKGLTMAANSSIGSTTGILTYTGAITDATGYTLTVNSGTVYLDANQSGNSHTNILVDGTASTLKLGASSTSLLTSYLPGGSLTLQNAGILQAAANMSLGKALTVGTGNGILDANATIVTLDAGMTGGNTLTIDSTGGAGTVILADGKDNSAATTSLTVSANGVLQFTKTNNLPATSTPVLTLNGGTLKVPANNTQATVPASVSLHIGSSGGTIDVGDSSTLEIVPSFTDTTGYALTLQNSTASSATNGIVAFTQYASPSTAATDNSSSHTTITVGTGTAGTSHITYQISDPLAKEIPGGGGTDSGTTFTGTQPVFTLNGGTLSTLSAVANSAIATAKVITLGASGGNVSVDGNTTLTLAGVLAGGYGLNANGAGILVLSGLNNTTASQSLTVSNGTVQIALPANVPGSFTPAITLAGGTFQPTATMALANPLTLQTDSTLKVDSSGNTLTSSGALTGTRTLEKTGAGIYAPTADNSGSASSIKLTGGTMQITATNQLPGGSAILTLNGGKFQVPTGSSADYAVSMPVKLGMTLAADSTIDVQDGHTGAGNLLTINNTSGFADTTGHTLTLTNSGAGTNPAIVALVSGVVNTASHTNLTVNPHVTLQFASGDNIPSAAAGSGTAGKLTMAGGTLTPTVTAQTITSPVTVSAASTFDTTNAASVIESYLVNSTTVVNDAQVVAANIYDTTISSTISTFSALVTAYSANNSLKLGGSAGTAVTTQTHTAAVAPSTISGVVAFTAGLTVKGGNTLLLSSTNTGTGGVTVSGSGTAIELTNATAAGTTSTDSTGVIALGTGTVLNAAITGNTGTIANPIAMSATALDTAKLLATNSVTASGLISGAADLTIDDASGGKTVTLSHATNTYTGKTILAGTATLSISAATQLSSAALIMGAGTTLKVTGSTAITLPCGISL